MQTRNFDDSQCRKRVYIRLVWSNAEEMINTRLKCASLNLEDLIFQNQQDLEDMTYELDKIAIWFIWKMKDESMYVQLDFLNVRSGFSLLD